MFDVVMMSHISFMNMIRRKRWWVFGHMVATAFLVCAYAACIIPVGEVGSHERLLLSRLLPRRALCFCMFAIYCDHCTEMSLL